MLFDNYHHTEHYDEMLSSEGCRKPYRQFQDFIGKFSKKKLYQLKDSANKAQMSMGMTFNVYHDNQGVEKILYLDLIPRIISGADWSHIERGLIQRTKALNLFIDDLYHDQEIIKAGVVPAELIASCQDYLSACQGITPPKGIWCHITGSDIVRDKEGKFYVLEDNLRCPSGVSYLLENREIIKQAFNGLFTEMGVRPVSNYPAMLLSTLQHLSEKQNPTVVVLTPGVYNSAYFEHSYLAQQMGVELVTGQDLIAKDKRVYMQTTKGMKQVDVIYRRIDDTFLDPLVFNPKSMLGVPGIMEAYRAGHVSLANAPGTGVADDKAIYAYVPRIIEFYLHEKIILDNVPTYLCSEKEDREYVLDNIAQLVVKETNAAGGYGMLIGPRASKTDHEKFRELIKKDPRKYIAQPTLSLSTVPSITKNGIAPRHVDLRPYILYGDEIRIMPGALTRVAMVEGSLVVNSSQGGGSKDTWVLFD